jgi:CHAT domain-containing protein
VSDRSTSTLMTAFYTEHLRRGLPAAAALREAQLAALAHPATSDPYHWAGFVYYGDWYLGDRQAVAELLPTTTE